VRRVAILCRSEILGSGLSKKGYKVLSCALVEQH
jgi:hypothetical protein